MGEADLTPEGELLGTPAYLAPERLEPGPVRPACDVYALGLLLYQALTGELPWRSHELTEVLAAHRRGVPPDLPAVAGLPAEVADLCRRCLARRPADRPTSAEVAGVLDQVAAGLASPPPLLPAPVSPAGTAAGLAASRDGTQAARLHRLTLTRRVTGWLPPDRRRRTAALMAFAGLAVLGLVVGFRTAVPDADPGSGSTGTGAAGGGTTCEVQYEVRRDSGAEFAVGVTLTNTGTGTVQPWRLDFSFPAGQEVVSASTEQWRQSGGRVVLEGAGDGASLPPGGSVVLGFEGRYQDRNPMPTAFHLNGSDCDGLLTAAAVPAEEPPTRSAPAAQAPPPAYREGPPGQRDEPPGHDRPPPGGDGGTDSGGTAEGGPAEPNGNGNGGEGGGPPWREDSWP